MFIGRKEEIRLLEKIFENTTNKSQLVRVDGRRRVGKTTIIERFMTSKVDECKDVYYLKFIGNNSCSYRENLAFCLNELKIQLREIASRLQQKKR